MNTIESYPIDFVQIGISEGVINLASLYIEQGIIPKKNYSDALHVALCIFNDIDILLSWNYKHLANIHRKKKINLLNHSENFIKPIEIITPLEVIDYE